MQLVLAKTERIACVRARRESDYGFENGGAKVLREWFAKVRAAKVWTEGKTMSSMSVGSRVWRKFAREKPNVP